MTGADYFYINVTPFEGGFLPVWFGEKSLITMTLEADAVYTSGGVCVCKQHKKSP